MVLADNEWVLRGIPGVNVTLGTPHVVQSSIFTSQAVSVWRLCDHCVGVLLGHKAYQLVAPLRGSWIRELDVEVTVDVSEPADGHHLNLAVNRRKGVAKKLRDLAQPLAVEVHTDAATLYDKLCAACKSWDDQNEHSSQAKYGDAQGQL
jgi:hypothetical protein